MVSSNVVAEVFSPGLRYGSCMASDAKSAVNRALGNEVRVWRTRRGLSRAALAEKTGLAVTQLARIENNERDMSLSQLFQIAWALDVQPERIVRDAVEANGGMEALVVEDAADE
jgi:transcriptional regulator with XRE-family HTH domain